MFAILIKALLLPSLASSVPTETRQHGARSLFQHNENHIFNAIYASLRQWDSSYYHNGMSFFIANVPVGTKLYHGALQASRVEHLQWFSFTREHAWDCVGEHDIGELGRAYTETIMLDELKRRHLQTYVTRHDLRLLYIDGMSAAKVYNGTLDSTEMLLLNKTGYGWDKPADYARAGDLCRRWPRDIIDGFIRMEEGFEPSSRANELLGYNGEHFWQVIFGDAQNNAVLDYDSMVTAYSPDYGIELFGQGRTELPRLTAMTSNQRMAVMRDVDALVLGGAKSGPHNLNWQKIVDAIVSHFAVELAYLIDTKWRAKGDFDLDLASFLLTYTDPRDDTGIERCTEAYLPVHPDDSVASRAVEAVAHTVCRELFGALTDSNLLLAQTRLASLKDSLGWSVWKHCKGCKSKEVCFLPIWFLGGQSDRDHPQCRNYSDFRLRKDYWGDRGQARPAK